jgi:pimeloyl-ACP methyl ester carboxylesterase
MLLNLPARPGAIRARRRCRQRGDGSSPRKRASERRTAAKAMASADPAPVHAAGNALIERIAKPVLLAWSCEDPVFPIAHAERYAAALPDARLVALDDSYSFTPEDQPVALAEAIAAFALSA